MHTEIVTLCHSAIEQGGQLSILAAFNNINVAELPHKFPPFTLACRLRFDPGEAGDHQLKATVADTDGRVLGQMSVAFQLFKKPSNLSSSMNLLFPISGMELRHAGEHTIDLILDDRPALRTPFFVIKV
jgi:hypothetical protein